MADFVHLHNHSQYSLLDATCRIEELVKTCKNYKMHAIALTDHGNMFGAIVFYKKAMNEGIKPIIGVESYIAPGSRHEKSKTKKSSDTAFHLVLLAKDDHGYRNLMKLTSVGYLEGFYYKPRIDKEILRQNSRGIIALSACMKGEVSRRFLKEGYESAYQAALEYKDIFGEDFYLEVQNHGIFEEKEIRECMYRLSDELNIKVVATNDIHYLKREHNKAHDVMLCLQTGKDRDDPQRLRYSTDQIYFKNSEEMAELFPDHPEVLSNTMEVADKCNLLLEFGKLHLPQFTLPADSSSHSLNDYLEKLAIAGLKKRYEKITPQLEERLRSELEVVEHMGYAGYFLIVQDFIAYAKSVGIPVGPGRGSAAGSLVSYALGITNIDPIKYDLIFERFLNPERVSMPDIDIDFCYERREEVIEYTKQKYGDSNVTQIITFGTMAARAVIRDVGRVLKMSYNEVDRIAKLIPQQIGVTLDEALRTVPELKKIAESDDLHKQLIEYSRTLEGLARHSSTHAAGVVITPGELTNYVPLFKSKDGEVTTQYDMKVLESVGLLKMDFLGLRTLTVLKNAINAIRKRGIEISLEDIPLNDEDTYRLFGRGETVGVFQFESSGMRDYLRKLKPQSLEDLIAMNALYRPGPMSMIDDFIKRKHGKTKIDYLHPILEPILKETYGICVYQEQVMRIAHEVGGFTLGGADLMRRAMGKKEPETMVRLREEFVKGAQEQKVSKDIADELFDQLEKFAGYGFNKSHAAGYSLVAFQTAYLKAHYPAEFMASTISSEMGSSDRVMILLDECRRMNIQVLPPDVNESFANFVVFGESIRFGLAAVKNVGRGAVEAIVRARKKHGKFETIFDFCRHVDLHTVNRKALESLILAGAMDSLPGHRAQLLAILDNAVGIGQTAQSEIARGQTSLFGADDKETIPDPLLPDMEQWSQSERLNREKGVLGYYVSGHPLDPFRDDVRTFSTVTLDAMDSIGDGAKIRVCGIITELKRYTDRKGQAMAFFKIEDFSGTAEGLIFSDAFEKHQSIFDTDALVMIVGKSSTREGEIAKIMAEEVVPLTETRERFAKSLCLAINPDDMGDSTLEKVKALVDMNKGDIPVYINLRFNDNGEFVLKSKTMKISPNAKLMESLREELGRENVWIGA